MDDKEIEKKLQDVWEETSEVQPEDKFEKSWQDFSSKTFNRKKKPIKPWHYAAAAVLVIFLSISGLWMYNNSTFEPSIASKINIIKNPGNQDKTVYLPDGSLVELEPHAQLEFSDNFRKNRKIRVKGEAFFRVKKDKDHPFQVSCKTTTTTVLGTEFNVKEEISNTVNVQLYEGSIQMSVKDSTNNWILSPGEKFVYNTNHLTITSFKRFKDFNKKPLKEVIKYIQTNYNYKITFPQELLQKQVTIRIRKKEKLSNITQILSEIYNLNSYRDENIKEITFK
ncbi:FecR family protein [Flavivirga sp. 57AJ16]|uniref:FecR family protein n=1 Tax=Flavivirga sp. 57AJ16 TaxID=3025307 RepID=UPI002365A78D|nr:FecR family protein [Flavivirga sp. 57AJ16]MDD7886769.1 FecR family protein [Flavivirga sp. 57AJ16]